MFNAIWQRLLEGKELGLQTAFDTARSLDVAQYVQIKASSVESRARFSVWKLFSRGLP